MQYFDAVLSYGKVEDLSARFAQMLVTDGFSPGDRLALVAQNTPKIMIAILGAWKSSGIAVTIYDTSAHLFQTRNDGRVLPEAVCTDPWFARVRPTPPLAETATLSGRDVAFLVYTFCTTGAAKGAVMDHDNLRWNAAMLAL